MNTTFLMILTLIVGLRAAKFANMVARVAIAVQSIGVAIGLERRSPTMCLIYGIVAAVGALCSVLLGCYAVEILNFNGCKPHYEDKKAPRLPWKIYQFCLNFICSAVGWAVAIYFLHRIQSNPSQFSFKVEDAIPLIVGLLGITGLLPRTLFFGKNLQP